MQMIRISVSEVAMENECKYILINASFFPFACHKNCDSSHSNTPGYEMLLLDLAMLF